MLQLGDDLQSEPRDEEASCGGRAESSALDVEEFLLLEVALPSNTPRPLAADTMHLCTWSVAPSS